MGNGIRLLTGGMIVLFILVVNLLVTFFTTGMASTDSPTGCSKTGNFTTCESESKGSFFSSVLHTSFTGIDGAPGIVNACYLTIMGFLLSLAVLLILSSFIPTLGA